MFTALSGPPRVQGSLNLIARSGEIHPPYLINVKHFQVLKIVEASSRVQWSLSNQRTSGDTNTTSVTTILLVQPLWQQLIVYLVSGMSTKSYPGTGADHHLPQSKIWPKKRWGQAQVKSLKMRLSSELSRELSSELLDGHHKNCAFQPKW